MLPVHLSDHSNLAKVEEKRREHDGEGKCDRSGVEEVPCRTVTSWLARFAGTRLEGFEGKVVENSGQHDWCLGSKKEGLTVRLPTPTPVVSVKAKWIEPNLVSFLLPNANERPAVPDARWKQV